MNRMLRHIVLLCLLATGITSAWAQVGSGTLKGKVTDVDTKEPVPFASVVLFLNGNQAAGTTTDFAGLPRFRDDPNAANAGAGNPPIVDRKN